MAKVPDLHHLAEKATDVYQDLLILMEKVWLTQVTFPSWMMVSSLESYRKVAKAMFEDGETNVGRLCVLKAYTQALAEKHPTLRDALWQEYKDVMHYQIASL